ncbi:MAG: SIR2 family protein [Candidatus Promineifilaceae bacterium]|nr:SIR2 family protein [Candidatus Promineifilaceae bacterium]
MSRLKARAEKRRQEAKRQEQAGFWPELCRRIEEGQVIPIISNSVIFDQIFDIDNDNILGINPSGENPQGWTIGEQLADAWAAEVGFPLSEQHWLPRVALFDRVVNSKDDLAAKSRYLNWLKDSLLYLATDDPEVDPQTIEELRDDIELNSFADTVVQLGYPKSVKSEANTLQLLARLKLPVYITTSYYDFLERAILADHRQPRTQICFWSNEPVTLEDKLHKTDYDFVPTPENPLVYHVFGLEAYPESMVLNEDDYLNFLAAVAKDAHQKTPILPPYLRKALTQSSLVLLGYRLRDWEFRVMFRGLIDTTPDSLRMFNLAIQLDPSHLNADIAEKVREYLKTYFEDVSFSVEWDSADGFMRRLWREWDLWRR